MAWLAGYTYRKPLVLTGGASGAQTDFQLNIDIAHVAAKMQADFDDIRFTQNNGTTLIDAWLESKVDSTSAETWAEFPTTPANTVEQTYYMYYGNAGAASDWDIETTFIFGDDVEGSGWDGAGTNGWTAIHGTPTIEKVVSPLYKGVYSMHLGATGGYEYTGRTFSSVDEFVLHYRLRVAETNLHHFLFVGTDYANPIRVLSLHSDGHLKYFNGAGWVNFPTDTTYSADAWNEVEIIVQTSSDIFEVIWNGTSIGSNLWDTTYTPTSCVMLIDGGADTSDIYMDDLFMRKYAANPPTYAFGAEESAPGGVPIFMQHYNQFNGGQLV